MVDLKSLLRKQGNIGTIIFWTWEYKVELLGPFFSDNSTNGLVKRDSISVDPPQQSFSTTLLGSEADKTTHMESELDNRNAVYEMFLSKGVSTKPLPKLSTTNSNLDFQLPSLKMDQSPGTPLLSKLGDDNYFNSRAPRFAEEFRRTATVRSQDSKSSNPIPLDKQGPLTLEKTPSGRRDATSISNLKQFLYKLFKNENVSPIPSLSKSELGLLSSVLTRKFGKPIQLK